jgi:hypothetical protein
MPATKTATLTDAQKYVLAGMLDDEYIFPGTRRRSCEVLKRLGFAESELMLFSANNGTGVRDFRLAYRRTPEGAAFIESK